MKRAARISKALKPKDSRARILLWACLLSLIFGAIEAGQPLEELLRSQRNSLHRQAASGEIVVIGIDNRSLKEIGRYPWMRSQYTDLVTKLDALGAKRIFVDSVMASYRSNPEEDQAFARGLQGARHRVVLPIGLAADQTTQTAVELGPLPEFAKYVQVANINAIATVFGTVRRLPYEVQSKGRRFPSFAALLANVHAGGLRDFRVDYSIDPRTIPLISAADVLNGQAARNSIAGKDIIVGVTYQPSPDTLLVPGYGVLPGVYLHVLGAETLRLGQPALLPWIWPWLLAMGLVIACLLINRRLASVVALGAGIAVLLAAPLLLEINHIFTDVLPAVFCLLIFGIGFSWATLRQMYRSRALTNAVSGLPNLNALSEESLDTARALVAARVHNYAAIASTLSVQGEKTLIEQMAKRLMVGTADPMLYQGDEGIFAWFADLDSGTPIGSHLEALHTLFQMPVTVQDRQFDLVITFGFDADGQRLIPNRLASALVAADEAYHEGLKWKEHDASKLEDSAWKLSLLSQLDSAIDAGDLWVAYQPKLDLATNTIIGAEALARWTHAEKGPISPIEFILAAEQSNRIEKLTRYVLEQAIRVAAEINGTCVDFNMSVNLSARLIDDTDLIRTVSELLFKYRLDPSHLTLEVTETAALGNLERSLSTLKQLREMGVLLSVDDYGTGMSTLDYLQRIPATEIKIDRSFVVGMRANQATRVMVNSTIQLAHSLGQKVVAEGVEDQETLDDLRRMNCDQAQGYLIGRPMTFRALTRLFPAISQEHAA